MTEEMPENFDGFILPDGEMVAIEDVDRMFSFIVRRHENEAEIRRFLQALFHQCADNDRFEAACGYMEKELTLVDSPEERAGCLLQLGQVRERSRDYKAALEGQGRYADAVECFIRATELCPMDPRALQLLENLLAVHCEILEENPDLLSKLHDCQEELQTVLGGLRPQ